MFSPQTIKKDFPIFTYHPARNATHSVAGGPDLVYLDSAATTLKPRVVIEAEKEYLEHYSANIARGLYPLAEKATEKFEMVREKVSTFIGAESAKEIIFTSGTTDSLNLAARLLASRLEAGDTIITTAMEHHSNFLPWKELAKKNGLHFRVIPLTEKGTIDIEILKNTIDERTKIVAFSAVSNVLGTINPVKEITTLIKNINPSTIVVIDAAQAVSHMPIDVSEWNADFVAFSGHKMFGPTGVGILYGKSSLLNTLSPVTFGGGMVIDACADETVYKEAPYRFEAGTPNIGGIIALGTAIDYMKSIGMENIQKYEHTLTVYALNRLRETFGENIHIIGPTYPEKQSGIIAFTLSTIHPHDIAATLGEHDICVRAGEHCASPLHKSLGLHATTRISFSIYNSKKDIDKCIAILEEIQTMFSK